MLPCTSKTGVKTVLDYKMMYNFKLALLRRVKEEVEDALFDAAGYEPSLLEKYAELGYRERGPTKEFYGCHFCSAFRSYQCLLDLRIRKSRGSTHQIIQSNEPYKHLLVCPACK